MMNHKKTSLFILAIAIIWTPTLLAETLPTSALDREVTSREGSMSWSNKMTDPPKWQPARLPEHVIPAVKPIEGPRNQKVRTMANMLPVSEKNKFHKVFKSPVVKVHPLAVKTVKVAPKLHPKPIKKE